MAFDLAGKLPERKESMSREVLVAIINAAAVIGAAVVSVLVAHALG